MLASQVRHLRLPTFSVEEIHADQERDDQLFPVVRARLALFYVHGVGQGAYEIEKF